MPEITARWIASLRSQRRRLSDQSETVLSVTSLETFDIDYVQSHLSELVDRAAKGEAFGIAKAGRPLVKVAPLEKLQRIGFMKGKIQVPDDFDRMFDDEIAELFGAK